MDCKTASALTCGRKSEDYDIVDAEIAQNARTLSHSDQIARDKLTGNKLAETPSKAILDCQVILAAVGGNVCVVVRDAQGFLGGRRGSRPLGVVVE